MTEEIAKMFIEAKKEMEMPKEELLEKLWDLQQRVHNAIEYIKGAYEMALYTKSVSLDEDNIEELLEILKGKENN